MKSCRECKHFRGITHEPQKQAMQNTNYPCTQQAIQRLHCGKLLESQLQVKKKCNEIGRPYTPFDDFYCSEKSVENVWHGDFCGMAENCNDYEQTLQKRQFDLFGDTFMEVK